VVPSLPFEEETAPVNIAVLCREFRERALGDAMYVLRKNEIAMAREKVCG
jgi:hypothetical protein